MRSVKPGEVLAGRYRIVKRVGEGGMGSVFLAEDVKLAGKQWAVKEISRRTEDVADFLEEAQMLARLNHPQLPRIVDYYVVEPNNVCYVVMDFIEGQTLQTWFANKQKKADAGSVLFFAVQLCDIFHYLHTIEPEPVIYRDLKPSNVIIGDDGGIKLVDFGTARSYKAGQNSDTVPLGTIGFASPEQLHGFQTDSRSDMYSLGAFVYHLLSGGGYYSMSRISLEKVNMALPEKLIDLVMSLLAEDPNSRPGSALEVKEELQKLHSPARNKSVNLGKNVSVDPKVIVVGSLYPGAGATFTAVSVARMLNRWGIPHAVMEHPAVEPELYTLLFGDRHAPKDYFSLTGSSAWTDEFTQWLALPPEGMKDEGGQAAPNIHHWLHSAKKPIRIVDIGFKWDDPSVKELCDAADLLLLVAEDCSVKINRPSSAAVLQVIEKYAESGQKVQLVVNRAGSPVGRKEWLEHFPDWKVLLLPGIAAEEVVSAVWKGRCVQDKPKYLEEASRCFSGLWKEVFTEGNPAPKSKGKILFKLFST